MDDRRLDRADIRDTAPRRMSNRTLPARALLFVLWPTPGRSICKKRVIMRLFELRRCVEIFREEHVVRKWRTRRYSDLLHRQGI